MFRSTKRTFYLSISRKSITFAERIIINKNFMLMKRIYLFIVFLCSVSTYAFQTTLTSSIYITENVTYRPSQSITDIPTGIRRVHFINQVDDNPEIETVLTAAEYIFSNAMDSVGVDLVNIKASVSLGGEDFEDNEVCKVSVDYVDGGVYHPYYPYFYSYDSSFPVRIPRTIYNQCNGLSEDTCIRIALNPKIPFHFKISKVPEEKVDLITILLRSLVIGCGIQSALDPQSLRFYAIDNVTRQNYITLFDAHIHNDENIRYSDVAVALTEHDSTLSPDKFLTNHIVYADGYYEGVNGDSTVMIPLYNDWECGQVGYAVTSKTLNTIGLGCYTKEDSINGLIDLLDSGPEYGMSVQEITPYSMALLQGLGWIKNVPVGFDDDFAFVRNSSLCCNSTILQPKQTYRAWLSDNVPHGDIVCKLQTKDSAYVIATGDYNGNFSFNTIPEGVQWKRNPITKNIIGQIQTTAEALIDNRFMKIEKTLDVEIPYKPNKPIVQKSESATDGNISLNLNAFANGSNTYTVTYTGITYNDTHTFTATATALDTILANIPGNQLYDLSIYGTNNEGNSASYTFTFGSSARPPLTLTISIIGNTLKYDLSNNGAIDISNVVINSVQITSRTGNLMMTPTANPGDPINISSLTRGYYVLTVIADGNTYSRVFTKR